MNFFLSEGDVAKLRRLLAWFDQFSGVVNPRLRPELPPPQTDDPSGYIVLVPPGGIPGVGEVGTGTGTGIDDPGSAECHLYQRFGGTNELQDLGYTEQVYNVGPAVPGNRYVLAVRTREGDLQIPQNGQTGGGGSGVTTVGAIDSQSPSANGLVIVSSTLYAQSASVSKPGMVNDVAQSFAGAKTFTDGLYVGITGSGGQYGSMALNKGGGSANKCELNFFVEQGSVGWGLTDATTAGGIGVRLVEYGIIFGNNQGLLLNAGDGTHQSSYGLWSISDSNNVFGSTVIIDLAPLTNLGTQGSVTITGGIVTDYTAPT